MKDVCKVTDARSWQWLRAGYLGKSTEGYAFATTLSGKMLILSIEFAERKWSKLGNWREGIVGTERVP